MVVGNYLLWIISVRKDSEKLVQKKIQATALDKEN